MQHESVIKSESLKWGHPVNPDSFHCPTGVQISEVPLQLGVAREIGQQTFTEVVPVAKYCSPIRLQHLIHMNSRQPLPHPVQGYIV